MFERPQGGERALLVHVRAGRSPYPEEIAEFRALATSAGAELAGELTAQLRTINPRSLIGRGKLDELKQLAQSTEADLVLVDHRLSPAQERNLERALQRRVIDRTGLILDIFSLRARSFEGKLQVELAQLEHLSTRLVRGWTHLERQKGGIGLRGPGETQLESDRRMLGQRIKQLNARLARLSGRRDLARRQRHKNNIPTVSLVGYTNAGKSTLFNRLADAGVTVANQLFATLDPTMRRIDLPRGEAIVLADTVGFVRDLPHELVAAFQSTLEEIRDARLLLHVVDCADPAHQERIGDVNGVLRRIGADHLPVIQVYNKADILGVPPRVDRAETGMPRRVWVSAASGAGIDDLLEVITEFLHRDLVRGTVRLAVSQARLRAAIYRCGSVIEERPLEDGGWELDLEIGRQEYRDLQVSENLRIEPSADIPRPAALR